jgi:hypothetical protein
MIIKFYDYKKFLGECQTKFGCSLPQAQTIARKLIIKNTKRKKITIAISYCVWGLVGLLISLFIISLPIPIGIKCILFVLVLIFCYVFGIFTLDVWNRHPTEDYYGISNAKIEQLKNQVVNV